MRHFFGACAALIVIGSGWAATAQTLYNSPTQQPSSGTVKPLNLNELLRGAPPASQSSQTAQNPYANFGAYDGGFEQRLQMLNQARAQRDRQAWKDQQDSLQYMAALAESDNPATFGVPPQQLQAQPGLTTTPLPVQPSVPLMYNKPKDGPQKPKPLFNSVQ